MYSWLQERKLLSWFQLLFCSTPYLIFSKYAASLTLYTGIFFFFFDGEDILYMCWPIHYPLVTHGYWALEIWQVWLRNWLVTITLYSTALDIIANTNIIANKLVFIVYCINILCLSHSYSLQSLHYYTVHSGRKKYWGIK